MARTPFDTYAKDLADALLRPYGTTVRDARIDAEPQQADLSFVLDPARQPRRPREFLARFVAPHALFEFAHNPPDLATMSSWVHKRDGWWRLLRNEALRSRSPPSPLPPTLVALSAGDPVEARRQYWLRPLDAMPGCYEGAPAGTFRLVVISALPCTRATLLVRTMGAGATLRRALRELQALPPNARERIKAGVYIARLRIALMDDNSDEAQEYRMDTAKIVDEMIQQQRRQGFELGVAQGVAQGVALLQRQCARRLGRALTATESATLRSRLDEVGPERLGDVLLDSDAASLAAWFADPDAR